MKKHVCLSLLLSFFSVPFSLKSDLKDSAYVSDTNKIYKVGVIGAGYVGLVLSACLADLGHEVVGADINAEKVAMLQRGEVPIVEVGLDGLIIKHLAMLDIEKDLDVVVKRNISSQRLFFTTNVAKTVKDCEIIFIAVDTPMGSDGAADLSAVKAVAEVIGKNLNGYKVICTKSTVPIGTGKMLQELIGQHASQEATFDMVSNPEFLREGSAIKDFFYPDRIVIGTQTKKAYEVMADLYRYFVDREVPLIVTNIQTAEAAKYFSNSFLAVKISFINEAANFCDFYGADVKKIAEVMGLDKRISPGFLQPGPGFGGSCFPKDLSALVAMGNDAGVDLAIASAAIKANQNQRMVIVKKLHDLLGSLNGKTIAVLGLTFKPDTDDIRKSPAIDIMNHLKQEGAIIKAYDPIGMNNMKEVVSGIKYCPSFEEAARGSDAALFLTAWDEFKAISLSWLKDMLTEAVLVDACNIFEPEALQEYGFRYQNVGRNF